MQIMALVVPTSNFPGEGVITGVMPQLGALPTNCLDPDPDSRGVVKRTVAAIAVL